MIRNVLIVFTFNLCDFSHVKNCNFTSQRRKPKSFRIRVGEKINIIYYEQFKKFQLE